MDHDDEACGEREECEEREECGGDDDEDDNGGDGGGDYFSCVSKHLPFSVTTLFCGDETILDKPVLAPINVTGMEYVWTETGTKTL